MKSALTSILIFIFGLISLRTAAQDLVWAKQIGSPTSDFGHAVAVDDNGNTIIAGNFSDSADIELSSGHVLLSSEGSLDIVLAKYDPVGNISWTKILRGVDYSYCYGIAVDGSGNIIITGTFTDSVDFDPGLGVAYHYAMNSWNIFLAKYDSNGNYLWARSFGSPTFTDIAIIVTLDDLGSIYLTGMYDGIVDFDPDTGISNLISIGNNDIFLAKYDANGNYIFAKSFGGVLVDTGASIAIDGNGNIILTGIFSDTVDFNPDIAVNNLISSGGFDLFYAKYDVNGDFIWAKKIGGLGDDYGYSIATDLLGNIYITGFFRDTVDFNSGSGINYLISNGGNDIFYSKYDSNGNYLWANQIGGIGFDESVCLKVDSSGNSYIVGRFRDTVDFDPSSVTNSLSSAGVNDIFFAKYDSGGNYLWSVSLQGDNGDLGRCIDIDEIGNCFIIGDFKGSIDIDPGIGTTNFTSFGDNDILFGKYASPATYIAPIGLSSTTTYTVYPNPSNGIYFIKMMVDKNNVPYEITDICGRRVVNGKVIDGQESVDISLAEPGVYLLKILEGIVRLVKQ